MKPGVQSTEFWASTLSSLWAAISPFLGASPVATIVPAVASGIYTVARTAVKVVAQIQAAKQTTAPPKVGSAAQVGGMIAGGSL